MPRGGRRLQRKYRRDRMAQGILLTLIVLLPIAVGGVHPLTNVVAAVALLTALGLTVFNHPGERVRIGAASSVLLLLLAWTACQLVPLPRMLLTVLSPRAAALRDVGSSYGMAPLSLDVPATCHELIKLLIYGSGTLLAAYLLTVPQRFMRLLWAVAAAGGGAMAIGVVHALARVNRPYGSFGIEGAEFVSSFVNPNHFGAYCGFTTLCILSLAALWQDRRRPLLWMLAAVTASGVFLSLSRGAILAFLLACLPITFTLLLRRIRGVFEQRLFLLATLLIAALILGTNYSPVIHELWTLSGPRGLHKADLWLPVPALLADFGMTGIAPGSLQSVYTGYQTMREMKSVPYLENQVLQTLVDWGWLIGGVALVTVAFAMAELVRWVWRVPGTLGCWSALAFLGLHNLVDFNLGATAVALPAAVLLETLDVQAHAGGPMRMWLPRIELSHRQLQGIFYGAAALLALCLYPALWHGVIADTQRLVDVIDPHRPDAGSDTQALLAWHPADYYLQLQVAERFIEKDSPNPQWALPYINRGLTLAPHNYQGHLLAGRALWRLGAADQSLSEFRLACEAQPARAHDIAVEVASFAGMAGVAQLAGDDPAVIETVVRFLIGQAANALALRVLQESHDFPRRPLLLAEAYLGVSDPQAAVREAVAAQIRDPNGSRGYLLEGMARANLGNISQANGAFERGMQVTHDADGLLLPWANTLLQHGEYEMARRLAETLIQRYAEPNKTALAHWLLGHVFELTGAYKDALREFGLARERMPATLSYRLDLARIYNRVGDHTAAWRELQTARAYLGDNPALLRALAAQSQTRVSAESLRDTALMQGH